MKRATDLYRVYAPVVDSATWCPILNRLYVKSADEFVVPDRYQSTECEFVDDPVDVYHTKKAILLKAATKPGDWDVPISAAMAPHRAVGSVIGASPFANAMTSGLIGGGVGYGVGHLLSRFLPDDYVDSKATKRWAALLGALGGAGLHLPSYLANMNYSKSRYGSSQPFKSLFSAPESIYDHTDTTKFDIQRGKPLPDRPEVSVPAAKIPTTFSTPQPFKTKTASDTNFDVMFKPIPVEQFTRTIWRDAGYSPFDTPPPVAAAASGLVNGVQNLFQTPSVTPFSIAQGLMVAGKDIATAKLVGGTLGAMGILTPAAQTALQRAGVWGGLLRGVMTAIF